MELLNVGCCSGTGVGGTFGGWGLVCSTILLSSAMISPCCSIIFATSLLSSPVNM